MAIYFRRCISFLLIVLSVFSVVYASTNQQQSAVLLNIKGGIGPATQDFISRGMNQAEERGAKAIILQIDTPGGLSKSMRGIIKSMLSAKIPVLAYVTPSGARAASAGTYILYAAQIAAMAPGTNLGAATPVAVGTPGAGGKKDQPKKPTAMEKKALNDARAYIRSLAQLRGRNEAWAEKAVVEGESLSAQEAFKHHVIDFIAKDVQALLTKADGRRVKVAGQEVTLQTKHLAIVSIEPDWRSRFLAVITDPSVAYILLMIGIYGIFFEFVNPGYVAPGVVGAIALLLGLYAMAMLPVSYVGLALLILGIAFIIAEAFMPSFGILGIGGAVSFIFGSIFLMKTEYVGFGIPIYLVIIVAAVTVAFLLLILGMALQSRRRPVVSGREVLLGKRGHVEVDADHKIWMTLVGERWQCQSDMPLEDGQLVAIKKLDGLTLIVEPVIHTKMKD